MPGNDVAELPRTSSNLFAILLTAAAFAATYGQPPLYYSNQNQYFVHGLACADYGLMREDWLANTLDPTPFLHWLVLGSYRIMPVWIFHVYQAIC